MSEPQSPYGIEIVSVAITLPLDVVESIIASAQRLGPGHLKPHDREMLAIAVREVEQVRGMVEANFGGREVTT